MKRHGKLWPQVVSFTNLYRAARAARRGKRHRPNVAAFEFDLERELCRLQAELNTKSYRPGPYRTFRIWEPKERLISAAPYRDRVVHHALCRVLEPIFDATFIADSYACRKGKGTHAAVDRFTYFARRFRYVLQCDIQSYFPSIDHVILKDLVARKVKDPDVLWLVNLLIDHANPQDPAPLWFAGDDLFTPCERRRGLPIGNQTSQFFANVYLNPFDHFVEETLRPAGYLRYVDDFALFGDDQRWLAAARDACRAALAELRLRLHPDKSVMARVADGSRFLGYRVFPAYRLLPRTKIVRLRRRWCWMQAALARGELSAADIRHRLVSWESHAQHADTFRLRQRVRSLMPGHPVG